MKEVIDILKNTIEYTTNPQWASALTFAVELIERNLPEASKETPKESSEESRQESSSESTGKDLSAIVKWSVKDLIEVLKQYPDKATVYTPVHSGDYYYKPLDRSAIEYKSYLDVVYIGR